MPPLSVFSSIKVSPNWRKPVQLEERKLIGRTGILMNQRGLSEEEAYKAMRKLAMSNNKRLVILPRVSLQRHNC